MTATLNELSTQLFALKDEKAQLNGRITEINGLIRDLEHSIWKLMDEGELLKFTTNEGTIYLSPQIVPKVVDWDAFFGYIYRNQAFHMLERRPSRAAFRELYEAHKPVPGVEAVEYDEVRTRRS
jgi:hypothetical protein